MDFVLGHGASYMEADIRDMTDKEASAVHISKKCLTMAIHSETPGY